jgi:ribosomal protein S18 acetylase RimI-like enzyme
MKIGPLKKVTEGALKDINSLIKQLRRKGDVIRGTRADLRSIVENKQSIMVVVEDKQRIVGMGTLYIQQKMGKRPAHLEDMVIDDEYRGQGLGKKLMQALIAVAKKNKVARIDLTSGHDRVGANALYEKMGFKRRDTNAYVLPL